MEHGADDHGSPRGLRPAGALGGGVLRRPAVQAALHGPARGGRPCARADRPAARALGGLRVPRGVPAHTRAALPDLPARADLRVGLLHEHPHHARQLLDDHAAGRGWPAGLRSRVRGAALPAPAAGRRPGTVLDPAAVRRDHLGDRPRGRARAVQGLRRAAAADDHLRGRVAVQRRHRRRPVLRRARCGQHRVPRRLDGRPRRRRLPGHGPGRCAPGPGRRERVRSGSAPHTLQRVRLGDPADHLRAPDLHHGRADQRAGLGDRQPGHQGVLDHRHHGVVTVPGQLRAALVDPAHRRVRRQSGRPPGVHRELAGLPAGRSAVRLDPGQRAPTCGS